jgi:hypothetical protein
VALDEQHVAVARVGEACEHAPAVLLQHHGGGVTARVPPHPPPAGTRLRAKHTTVFRVISVVAVD